jgi:transposase
MKRRYELSDAQWTLIEPLLGQEDKGFGRPRRDDRTLLNGIFWMLNSGASWRDLPERYGPWQTVYDRFRHWQKQGVVERILQALRLKLDEQGLIEPTTWHIDATMIKAHKAAAGAGKKKWSPGAGKKPGRLQQ